MRRPTNFNPEWGYLAPAPSFVRSARLVVVAAAIGAVAGAGVVFSLTERPAAEGSVAARTLVQEPVVATAPAAASAPVVAQSPAESQHVSPQAVSRADTSGMGQRQAAAPAATNGGAAHVAAGEPGSTAAERRAVSALALAESPAVANTPPAQNANEAAIAAPEAAPPPKAPVRRPRAAWRTGPRYYYDARYGQRYVQMGPPMAWRSFDDRDY